MYLELFGNKIVLVAPYTDFATKNVIAPLE